MMKSGENYIAVKIDIVNSRKIEERKKLQEKFLKITQSDANLVFEESIISRFVVTHGDELQVLLEVGPAVVDIINFFIDEMEPIKIRFGIGIGNLSTIIQPLAIGMDGQAFHFAKEAIDVAHNKKKYVVVKTESELQTRVFNSFFDLMFSIRDDWSPIQKEIISLTRKGYVQESIASYLNISQPAVSKNLRNAKWKSYYEAEETLKAIFEELDLII